MAPWLIDVSCFICGPRIYKDCERRPPEVFGYGIVFLYAAGFDGMVDLWAYFGAEDAIISICRLNHASSERY